VNVPTGFIQRKAETTIIDSILKTLIFTYCFFSFGVGLFIYQSLDAIDGKQARRTQTSGPLGELFDHGKSVIDIKWM
jgi:phosphatidylglycerophosphate synthase